MNGEVNRYTLNLICNKKKYPLVISDLRTIDFVTSSFNKIDELIYFLKTYYNIKNEVSDITITYNANHSEKTIPVLYYDKRGIVVNNDIPKLMGSFIITNYKLDAFDDINRYIKTQIDNMREHTSETREDIKSRMFYSSKIRLHLLEEYRTRRDVALYLDEVAANLPYKLEGDDKTTVGTVRALIDNMKMVYNGSQLSINDLDKVDNKQTANIK